MTTRRTAPARRTSILCYGDGNTHGTRATTTPGAVSRFRGNVRWTGALATALGPSVRVIEEGLPDRTTVHDDPVEGAHKNGLRFLPAALETHRPVDIVFLMLGTSDLKARYAMTAADVARSLERLLMCIAGAPCGPNGTPPQAVVIAPAPILERGPLAQTFAGGAEKSLALCHHLAESAERFGAGFIDAGAHAEVDPTDGVHLGEAGHAALGAALAAYARSHLLEACRPSAPVSRLRRGAR